MKNTIWLASLIVCLFFSPQSFARELFNYQLNPVLTEKQIHFANAWKTQTAGEFSYFLVDDSLLLTNSFQVTLPLYPNLWVSRQKMETHENGVISWLGEIENGAGNISLVLHDHMITATVFYRNEMFLVYPIGENMHIIFKTVPENYPDDESEEAYNQMIENGENAAGQSQIHFDDEAGKFIDNSSVPGDCNVRILVAFTTTAKNNLADPIGFVQSCIDATNLAYTNSSVFFQCELARSLEENYAETLNSQTDVNNFRGTSDGFMDDVHSVRNSYDADLCVLITENLESGICGRAYDVAVVPYSDGFCVVSRTCAVGNLSFPHELGHLYGCRHDPYVDNTNTPYAYGHGYVYQPALWRTIMAYNDQCDCSDETTPCPSFNSRNTPGSPSCTRLQYFSNPSVSYNGQAMGVASTNDNELALEVSVYSIIALQTDVANKVPLNEIIYSGETANLYATNSIVNSSAYEINSGASGSWVAGTFVDMTTGFWAKAGSSFVIQNNSCNALRLEENDLLPGETLLLSDGLQFYPNPFMNDAEVFFNLSEQLNVSVYITNLMGQRVIDLIENSTLDAGAYKSSVNGSGLTAGVYFLVVERGNTQSILKITKIE